MFYSSPRLWRSSPCKSLPCLGLGAALLLAVAAPAQAQTAISWQATVGTSDVEYATGSAPTADGGFITGGKAFYPLISADREYWIGKLDASHAIQWQKTYGGFGLDQMSDVIPVSTGGYLLVGTSASNAGKDKTENSLGGNDFWLVRVDDLGNVIWDETIGGSGADMLAAVGEAPDGSIYLAGTSSSGLGGDKWEPSLGGTDIWLMKVSSDGSHILWQRTLGGASNDGTFRDAMTVTDDGGVVLAGHSASGIGGEKSEPSQGGNDYWVVKFTAAGVVEWDRTLGGTGSDIATGIVQDRSGNYLVTGMSTSGATGDKTSAAFGGEDIWALKLGSQGTVIWQTVLGRNGTDVPTGVVQTLDDGYAIGSYSNSPGVGPNPGNKWHPTHGLYDYWLVKLDTAGQIQWQTDRGGTGDDRAYSLHELSDGTLVMGGYSDSGAQFDKAVASQDYDGWLLALDYPTPGLSAFHFEDPYGNVETEFPCGNLDIFLDGSASQNEAAYYIDAWRRPIGSLVPFSWAAGLGWNVGTVELINLTEAFDAVSFSFDPGYEYQIKVAVQNLPSFGWVENTEVFTVPEIQFVCAEPEPRRE